MPTYVSGHGGYVQTSVNGSSWVTHDVATWTLTDGSRTTENTHSGTGGGTRYDHVVKDPNWRLELPWDQDSPPDVNFSSGQKIYVRFKHGAGAVIRQCSLTTVENIETVDNNASDIVRSTVSGKGGVIS